MAIVVSGGEDAKPFSCTDDEEDALLKEAISCNRNLDLKLDDDDDEDESLKTEEDSDKTISNGNAADDIDKKKSDSAETNELSNDSDTTSDEDIMEIEVMSTDIFSPNRKRLREGDDNFENEEGLKVFRNRRNSNSSGSTMSANSKNQEYETDPTVLARRQKDIDYGKNTIGYDRYTNQIPKDKRTKDHPRTPPMYTKYSRRGWDGMVKLWRKQLHFWDPENQSEGTKENTEF